MKRTHGLLVGLVLAVVVFVAVFEMTGLRGSLTGAATGTGGGGCAVEAPPAVAVPDELPQDVRLIETTFVRPKVRPTKPGGSAIMAQRFVVSFAPEAFVSPALGDDGVFRLGSRAVDDALGALQTHDLAPAFSNLGQAPERAAAMGLDRIYVFESATDPAEVLASLFQVAEVEWVEPDIMETVHIDDPYYGYQWHLQQLGLESVWATTDGSGVVVAVLDTGVSAGSDGFASLLPGNDLVDGDNDASDEHGHGTHVSGTIAQATDNGVGVAGVAPGASILPVRVLDASGSGYASRTAEGIRWATDNGAQVINMSLGAAAQSSLREAACDYAYEAGVVVVASSGNDSYTEFVSYPAANDAVIAVGATDLNRDIAYYSNQGEQMELSAPGGDATVDHNGDGLGDGVVQETFYLPYNYPWGYYSFQGTSMAAPHVSGVAALLIANGLDSAEVVREALTSTAVDLGGPGRDTVYGYGLVDPAAALAYTSQAPPALEIKGLRSRSVGPARALVRWHTSVPSAHTIAGDNGYTTAETSLFRSHRALVRGAPGTTAEFEVTCTAADGSVGTATLSVTFQ